MAHLDLEVWLEKGAGEAAHFTAVPVGTGTLFGIDRDEDRNNFV